MKLASILGIRGARDRPKDSYGSTAYSFFFPRQGPLPCCLSLTGISARSGMCCTTVLPAGRRSKGKTNEEGREVQTETLTIKARPLASGYVKAKTGNRTSAETYEGWYKSVYLPTPKTEAGGGEEFSLEMFENIAYTMAKHADPAIPDDVEEWLDGFNTFSIYQVLPELIKLWGLNVQTDAEAKKTSSDRA